MTLPETAISTDQAIALFDRHVPAKVEDILGRWIGSDVSTGHPMDGLLQAAYWHGKIFKSADEVHPLVHNIPFWGELCINPALLPVGLAMAMPGRKVVYPLIVPLIAPLLSTRKPTARLKTIDFRGRRHAAMIYNAKPIADVFVQIDADTLLGWMDYVAMDRPFFFKLTRDHPAKR